MDKWVLNNRYEIRELIAEGGMSRVYKAWCRKTRRIVAIKILRPELKDKPNFGAILEGFKTEAYTTMRLHHRNIVSTIDVGKTEDSRFMVMEYLEGVSLKEALDKKGRFSAEECTKLGMRLCNALNYAHHKGILHKDLKPQNIHIDSDGEPIIMDFGIAEEISAKKHEDSAQVMGSVHYFSPEQARGEQLDKRSDIYSLGVVLYELCTGTLPFIADDDLSVALKHLHEPPKPPQDICSKLPLSLCQVILKAMSKEKEERYISAIEMYRDLARCMDEPDGNYVDVKNDSHAKQKQKDKLHSKKNVKVAGGMLALAVVVLSGLTVVFTSSIGNSLGTPKQIFMPYVVEKELQNAVNVLKSGAMESMEIDVYVEYEPSADGSTGIVMKQSPETGAVLKKDSKVTLVVSSEPVKQHMPDIVGMTLDEAEKVLGEKNLHVFDIVTKESDEPGKVLSQMPQKDTLIDGEKVVLTVGVEALSVSAKSSPLDILGNGIDIAIEKLQAAGYDRVLVREYPNSADLPGTVIDQYVPLDTDDEKVALIDISERGDSDYYGIYAPTTELGEGVLTLTVRGCYSSEIAETVVFRDWIESTEDFLNTHGLNYTFDIFLGLQSSSQPMELRVYKDDVLIEKLIIPMLRIEN